VSRRRRLTGLLRHPTEPRVLLLRGDRTWRLPSVLATRDTWIADALAAVPAYERRLGTRPWILRALGWTDGAAVQELVVDDEWRPPANGRWAGREDLDRLRVDEEQRAVAAAYLDALETVPPQRPPWARVGWCDEVRAWLEVELARLGRRFVGLEQVKTWSISTVLRVESDRGDLWFKASAALPLFVNEALVMQRLAERFPGHVPAPVSVDAERGWILLEPFEVVGWSAPLDVRCELFRRFAGLQLRTAELATELLAGGCLDRRLDVLEGQVDALLADRPALHGLTTAEVRALRRLAPRFHELCRHLGALGLPATLVHGDLHPANVAHVGGDLAYFDWTDACVAHPFVDLHSLQWVQDERAREALLDAYLEPWRAVAREEMLREAVALARAVTPLHHAVSYSTIAASVEPTSKPELDATDDFLREAMARARDF
jgi:Phosphotransferase enzyme family